MAVLATFALVAAACGDSDDDDSAPATTAAEADGGSDDAGSDEDMDEHMGSLDSCPNPIVIQTDWFPESEHGGVYALMGGDFTVDAESGRSSGPLVGHPEITVEVRAGGPYLGDQDTISVLAVDSDIFLGYVNTDEAVANYDRFPTTAVVAPLEINPQMVMWDPETYDVSEWADVGESGATILAFAGGYYPEWLIGSGLTDEGQWDFSYTGAPDRFIAAEGDLMQQGFATQEPYNYENVFAQWGKPVETLLVHDSGYEIYQGALAMLDENMDEAAHECLAAFVPIAQQAMVDFVASPDATNAAILQAVIDLDSFWELSEEGIAWTTEQLVSGGFMSNGPNATAGDFDLDRIQGVLDVLESSVPGIDVPEGLTPEDLVTNEFIDSSIGF